MNPGRVRLAAPPSRMTGAALLIYITIPAHDEARTLGVVLWKVRKVMAEFGRDYEVVVLDDASTDDTAEVLDRYRRVLPLRVIRTESRIGYGAALERLLADAASRSAYPKRDVVVTLQADFTEDPEDLVPMVKALEGGADLVAGTAEGRGEGLSRPVRLSRWAAGALLGRGMRGAPVSDPLCGYRAYRAVVLRKALRGGDSAASPLEGGWAANLRLLSRTAPHARRIEESPVRIRTAHRARASRFRPVAELKALLPLRRTDWPSFQEAS